MMTALKMLVGDLEQGFRPGSQGANEYSRTGLTCVKPAHCSRARSLATKHYQCNANVRLKLQSVDLPTLLQHRPAIGDINFYGGIISMLIALQLLLREVLDSEDAEAAVSLFRRNTS